MMLCVVGRATSVVVGRDLSLWSMSVVVLGSVTSVIIGGDLSP